MTLIQRMAAVSWMMDCLTVHWVMVSPMSAKGHCLPESMLIVSDLPDVNVEKLVVNCPPSNPYVTPPTTPEKPRRISHPSPVFSTPTTVGRILQEVSTTVPINAAPEKLGARCKRLGFQFLVNEYRKFHQSRRDSDPTIEALPEEKINTWANRLIHVADLLVLSPPSNMAYFAEEHIRILGLIFAKDKTFLSLTFEADFC
jgi:hypothetical protein